MSPLSKINTSRSPLMYGVVAATLATLSVGGATAIAQHKTVTVDVDGDLIQVGTMSSNVSGALAAAGYSVGEHDAVAPAVNSDLHDGDTVVFRRGREVALTVDGQQRSVWTTALTVDEALEQFRLAGDVHVSASRSQRLPLEGADLDVLNPRTVRLIDGAKAATDVRLAAPTVGEFLAAHGTPLEQADTVVPAADTPLAEGMDITVTRGRTETRVVTEPVAPPEQRIEDPEMNMSRTVVENPGRSGVADITYEVTMVNGVETGRKPVGSTVRVAPEPKVVRVGAKPGTEVPPVQNGATWDAL
ncbi:MAG: ubiquitin-like domain-containing protein, partial [Nocardiaceae bacterium]|nr:ubiquitin-like domain-containing protein [Nocardiaceae bacterium]